MTTLVCIVEGEGEVQSMRSLIHKIVGWENYIDIPQPKNAHGRNNLVKDGGIEKFLKLARFEPVCDGVLVLIDADDGCAANIAKGLAARAARLGLPFPVAVVCAKCEYEAWFLASLEKIRGHYDIPGDAEFDGNVEEIEGAKGWLTRQMPKETIYKETYHQVRMTELLEPDLVRERSRSFRRLEHAIQELIDGEITVSPE